MTLKMLSLFSGIGGIDLAAQWAGIETVAFCEIEPFCQKVLAKHWPDVPIFNDVKQLTAESLREHGIDAVDIIAGGFPCQDLSFAGKGAGIEGERSGLWREFCRLIRVLRPRFVLVENVAALLDRGMGRVLSDLAACRYDAEWQVLSAAAFSAPHKRERLFIIAYPNQIRRRAIFNNQVEFQTREAPQLWDSFRAVSREVWLKDYCDLSGNDDGVSPELDAPRFAALGNAVVPQVVYPIFEAIVTHEAARTA